MTQTASPPRSALTPSLSPGGAVLLLAGPLLALCSELIAPREPNGMSKSEDLRFLADHSGRLTASWVVGLVATAALATAYVMVAQRLTGRGRIVGTTAAVFGVLGAVSLAGHYAVSLAALDVAMKDAAFVDAVAAIEDGRATMATIPFVVLGLNLAIVLVAIAGARAGWVPRSVIALGVLALMGDLSPTNYNTVIHDVFAALVFGFIAAGLRQPSAAATT